MDANREYKDTVFTFLFRKPQQLVKLYNALSGCDYPPDTPVEDVTLENVLYYGKHNDLAFVIDGKVVILIEQQSTLNENMPVRILIYIAKVYEKLLANENVYKAKQIPLPRPEVVVLYNGADALPENCKVLKLSSAFDEPKGMLGKVEIEVPVLNINEGHNADMLRRYDELYGYSYFVARVREFKSQGCTLAEAIYKAVEHCKNRDILKEFLTYHSKEVTSMLTVEFDMDTALRVRGEEQRNEGKIEGKLEGLITTAKKMLKMGMDVLLVSDITELDSTKVREIAANL